jgi:cardiolipin synthase
MTDKVFPITSNNHVELLLDGEEYKEKYLSLIQKANSIIHLQTYIFSLDEFGRAVCNELIKASHRGVAIYVLVDSVGSNDFSSEVENELKSFGINFFRFNGIRLKFLYRWGRRLHHKVLLIDQTICIVGGINVQSPYDFIGDVPRLDFAVYLEGAVTLKISDYCQKLLNTECGNVFHFKNYHNKYSRNTDGYDVGISVNDWVYGHRKLTRQYALLTIEATSDITIINSYFFPRKKFMKQLAAAAKRGVRVRLILPIMSDWPSYILASEYLYEYFLKNNVEVYRWKNSILHGKLASIDGTWSTIGSYNLNYTSYQQNLEMNVNVYSRKFTQIVNFEIEKIINEGCERVHESTFSENSSFRIKISRMFFYLILSIVANLSIGLTFQDEVSKKNRFLNSLRFSASILFFIMGIFGLMLPVLPGIPFFVISFLLIYRQVLLNKKRG